MGEFHTGASQKRTMASHGFFHLEYPPFYGAPPLGARLEGPTVLLVPTCPSKKDVVGSFAECGKRGGAAGRAPPYPSQNGFRVLPPHPLTQKYSAQFQDSDGRGPARIY